MTEAHGASALTAAEIKTVLQKAPQGDTTVLPALRTWMDRSPAAWEELGRSPAAWEELGNLARVARDTLLTVVSGDTNLLRREAVTRQCAALTAALAGATPSPVEQLVVERVVLCWLHLSYTETLYVTNLEQLSYQQDAFYQQRISMAQARYLAAIRTLAQVRRLGVPAMQVNIGGPQVNVTG